MSTALLFTLLFAAAGCNLSDNKNNNKYSSTVEADSFYISSQVSGQVTELDISQGDKIITGQLVAKLDSKAYELQKNEAQGSLKIAKVSLMDSRRMLPRVSRMPHRVQWIRLRQQWL